MSEKQEVTENKAHTSPVGAGIKRRRMLGGMGVLGLLCGIIVTGIILIDYSDIADFGLAHLSRKRMKSLEAEPVWLSGDRESVLPRSPKPADMIYTFDVAGVNGEDCTLLTTLQGLVNRDKPELYVVSSTGPSTYHDDFKWIKWLKENGYVNDYTSIDNFKDVLEKWNINEVILIDPELPASVNVATMMAAFEGIPVAYPGTVERFGLNVKIDLTGRFQTNIEAYQWAFDEYWDRMNHSVVAWYTPQASHQHLRDYLVAHKIFTFWVTGEGEGTPENSNTKAESEFIRKLMAEKMPVCIPVLGFPYTENGGIDEVEGVQIISRSGKYLVCSDWMPNQSVWSGLEAKKKQYKQLPARSVELEDDKVYVTLLMSDGDNMNTWFSWFPEYWESPQHGRIPMAWAMGPALLDMRGPLVDYYYDGLTPADSIGCALTGIGYVLPVAFAADFKEEHRDKIWKDYLRTTDEYMQKFDMNWLHSHRTARIKDMPYDDMAELSAVKSIFSDYWGWLSYDKTHYLVGDVPVFHALQVSNPFMGSNYILRNDPINIILKHTPQERPLFMHIFLENWNWKFPAVEKLVDGLPEDFVVVRPDEMTALYEQWQKQQ